MKNWHPARSEDVGNLGLPSFRAGEVLVGLYDNGSEETPVLISSHGIWLRIDGTWRPFNYADMEAVLGPGEGDPRDASGVWIQLRSGRSVKVPVLGGDEGFRDAWEFSRFFMRILGN
jgi:hypothetical protein